MTAAPSDNGDNCPARVARIRLKHYRSIRACDVDLGALTFLVGPNGAGKSNFLDALRLVTDSLTSSLDQALRERGGINEVRRRSPGHPHHVSVRLDLQLPGQIASYAFEIGARRGGFEVTRETCSISGVNHPQSWFKVEHGSIVSTSGPSLPLSADRLYLVTAASLPVFRPVFDVLSKMGFYNLNPDIIRDLQTPDAGDRLSRDGRNLASVLQRLVEVEPASKRMIDDFLGVVVPGVVDVQRESLGPKETLEFRQQVSGAQSPWSFRAQSISDGTLRALGVLVAVFQQDPASGGPPLVGIEEPETAVHPAAAAVLRDALTEASLRRQIVVTSHSPELLDNPDLDPAAIVAVEAEGGVTSLARPNAVGRTALRDRLFTAGELLRINQLIPDPDAQVDPGQLAIFDRLPA